MASDIERNETDGPEFAWSDKELKLIEIMVTMMEIDPTYERLERVFEKALRLVRRMQEGR